jgi:hypothetical protein
MKFIRNAGFALAVAACLFATAAPAQLMGIFGDIRARIISIFTAIAPQVFPSALFGAAVAPGAGAANQGLVVPAGATYVPPTTTSISSWVFVFEGVVNSNMLTGSYGGEAIGANCTNSTCGNSGSHQIVLSNIGSPVALDLQVFFKGPISGYPFWVPYQATSSASTAGAGYTPGYYLWALSATQITAGSCTVYPSGSYTVTGSTVTAPRITQPGMCAPGTTFSGLSLTSGAPTTPGSLTVTMGQLGYTGVSAKPGQHFCAAIGQWGSDASVPVGIRGQQFVIAVYDQGNHLTGSPAISTTSNIGVGLTYSFYTYNTGAAIPNTAIGNLITTIGTNYNANGQYANWGGQLSNVGMIWWQWPQVGSAPDTAPLASMCKKQVDPLAYFQAQSGATVRSFYKLDPSTNILTDSGPNGYTLTPITSAPTSGSPTAQGAALTITDTGPSTVYPVSSFFVGTVAVGSGPVAISGTYNPTALGGTPTAIEAQVSATPGGSPLAGCLSCAWGSIATPSGGTWSGSVPNVPAGGPYYVSVRASNAPNFVQTSGPVSVGEVVALQGQSQMAYLCTGQTGNTLSPTSNLGWALGGETNNVSQTVAGVPIGSLAFQPVTPTTVPGQNITTQVNLGDGCTAYLQSLATLTANVTGNSWPIQMLNLTYSGRYAEVWLNGYLQIKNWLAGSGTGPYTANVLASASNINGNTTSGSNIINVTGIGSGTLQAGMSIGSATNLAVGIIQPFGTSGTTGAGGAGTYAVSTTQPGGTFVAASANAVNYGLYPAMAGANNDMTSVNMVLAGTMIFKDATGAVLGQDTAPLVMNTSTSTTCSGATIASCSIDYVNGGVSITFTTPPAGPITATWTNIVDVAPTGYGGIYDGIDYVGNGDPATGTLSAMMAHVPAGINLMLFSQCTMNSNEVAAYGVGKLSMSQKYDYLFNVKYPSVFKGYSSTTPILSLEHFRDSQNVSTGTAGQILGCMAWLRDYGLSGGNHVYGGSYPDPTSQGAGPHESNGFYGGQRFGRRMAINSAAQWWPLAVPNQEPTIASAVLGYSGSGNAYDAGCTAPGGGASSCINIQFTMNNPLATSLATCGPNLNGTGGAGEWAATSVAGLAGTTTSGSNIINITTNPGTIAPGMWLYGSTALVSGNVQPFGTGGSTGSGGTGTYALSSTQTGASFTGVSAQFNAANGTCADAGIGQHVSGFRIGPHPVPSGNAGNVFEDGADPIAASGSAGMTITPSLAFSCTQVAATTVQCRRTTGTWTGGSTYLTYGEPWSSSRDITLQGTPGAVNGLPIPTPGTCTTSGSATVALTGTGAGSLKVDYTTAGIQRAYPATTGYLIHTNPTTLASAVPNCSGYSITLPAACVGPGTPTIPCFGNLISSANVTGQLLYDNSGSAAASGISGTATAGSNVISVSGVTTGSLVRGMILSGTGLTSGVVQAVSGSLPTLSVTLTTKQAGGSFSGASASSVIGSVLGGYEPGLPVTPVIGAAAGYAITVTP